MAWDWQGKGYARVGETQGQPPQGQDLQQRVWTRLGGNTFEVAELIMQKGFAIFSPGPEKAAHDALGGTERGQFTVKSQLQTPTSNRLSARAAKTRIYSVAYTTERAK